MQKGQKIPKSIRLDQTTYDKAEKLLLFKREEATKLGQTPPKFNNIIEEAVNFYYAYTINADDDHRINSLYADELNEIMNLHLRPLVQMLNNINLNILTNLEISDLTYKINPFGESANLDDKLNEKGAIHEAKQHVIQKLKNGQSGSD